ncbi:armadillo-type protein [Pisolithus thermaeus]|nr:armadillo-type protein [Pisolithus thermaeus]
MTYFEVGWEWPLQFNDTVAEPKGLERLATDVEHPLHDNDKDRQLYACISLPSLCKNSWFRERLLKDHNLRRLIQLTKAGSNGKKREEGAVSASNVALYSSHALASLLRVDESLAPKLLAMAEVVDLIHALRNDHHAVVVAVLRTLHSLVGHPSHAIMSHENIVPTFLSLVQRCDDFVAPAAVEVVCSMAADESMREAFIKSGALSLFNDMLRKRSDVVMAAGAKGLATFTKHDE